MKSGLVISVVVGATGLALWSAWNPGFYYLYRAAILTLVGATAIFVQVKRGRFGPYAPTGSLLYVTAVLGIAVAGEEATAPAVQAESITTWYLPLVALSLIATVVTALFTRFDHRR